MAIPDIIKIDDTKLSGAYRQLYPFAHHFCEDEGLLEATASALVAHKELLGRFPTGILRSCGAGSNDKIIWVSVYDIKSGQERVKYTYIVDLGRRDVVLL